MIVQISVRQFNAHAHLSEMVPVVKELAVDAPVPIALNLDHGFELEDEVTAIQAGFTNVMIDGSGLPYEENVQKTRTVVSLAHPAGVSVEAELGHVGQAAAGDGRKADMYTDVDQACDFVERTGVDALAVAIGTAHGAYPKGFVPKLDFNRLVELKKALQMPLVLHGGSGSGDENIRKVVEGGINKINVCTDAWSAAKSGVVGLLEKNPDADYMAMEMAAEASVKEFVRGYVRLIGSAGKSAF